jgi:hypothetical protein
MPCVAVKRQDITRLDFVGKEHKGRLLNIESRLSSNLNFYNTWTNIFFFQPTKKFF